MAHRAPCCWRASLFCLILAEVYSARICCDETCRQALANAVCTALHNLQAPAEVEQQAVRKGSAQFLLFPLFRPQLLRRTSAFSSEFGCENASATAAVQGKSVENGKSAMGFLVAGGPGVDAEKPSSFSIILKELNSQESSLMPSLVPLLLRRYSSAAGSLLARFYGYLRYVSPDGGSFDAVMMENIVRPPPGWSPPLTEATARLWRPFDLKGIRLYSHEKRFAELFGHDGLQVSPRHFSRLENAVRGDVDLLRSQQLVDYSCLLTAFPLPTPPVTRSKLQRQLATAQPPRRLRVGSSSLSPTLGSRPSEDFSFDAGLTRSFTAFYCKDANSSSQHARHDLCHRVLVRVGLIDYLRQWRMVERAEHLKKTLIRDLRARERNHAVVPVNEFAAHFASFFERSLFRSVQPPLASRRTLLHDLATGARSWFCGMLCEVQAGQPKRRAMCSLAGCSQDAVYPGLPTNELGRRHPVTSSSSGLQQQSSGSNSAHFRPSWSQMKSGASRY